MVAASSSRSGRACARRCERSHRDVEDAFELGGRSLGAHAAARPVECRAIGRAPSRDDHARDEPGVGPFDVRDEHVACFVGELAKARAKGRALVDHFPKPEHAAIELREHALGGDEPRDLRTKRDEHVVVSAVRENRAKELHAFELAIEHEIFFAREIVEDRHLRDFRSARDVLERHSVEPACVEQHRRRA